MASSFDPPIEREFQLVLIAPVLKNSSVRGHWREVAALLKILPINDFVSFPCNDNYASHFSVSQNRGRIWLYCVPAECGKLFIVTSRPGRSSELGQPSLASIPCGDRAAFQLTSSKT